MSDPPARNRVFVGGISWKADEASLANFFAQYGAVTECKIIMDRTTGKSKGYGFVTFQESDSADRVKQTANFFFLGKNMNVGDAMRKSESNDSPVISGGNGGGANGSGSGRERSSNNNGGYQQYHYYGNNYYPRQQGDYQPYYVQYSQTPTYFVPQPYAYTNYPQHAGYIGVPYQYGGPHVQQVAFAEQPYNQPYRQDSSHHAQQDQLDHQTSINSSSSSSQIQRSPPVAQQSTVAAESS